MKRRVIAVVLVFVGVSVIVFQFVTNAKMATTSEVSRTDHSLTTITTDFQIGWPFLLVGVCLAGLGVVLFLSGQRKEPTIS